MHPLVLVCGMCVYVCTGLAGQERSDDAPKVFFDCRAHCYYTHLKTELTYLHFVNDRHDADVYVMITAFTTGSGGRQYTIATSGRHRFAGMADTVIFYSEQGTTSNEYQELMAQKVARSLLHYILKTSVADHLIIGHESPDSLNEMITARDDPWNSWVFDVGGSASGSVEETTENFRLRAHVLANRVTHESKFTSRVNLNYHQQNFDLEDAQYTSIKRALSARLLYVKSINDHWSFGGFGRIWSDTYANYMLGVSLRAAVEYNLFPYSDFTRRQFTILYRAGPSLYNYEEKTIFGKTEEVVVQQSLSVHYKRLEPWGAIQIWFDYSNFLHDWDMVRLSLYPYIEWNLVKGLQINISGGLSLIRDQVNITHTGVTDEERLLQIKQLKTDYRLRGSVGVSYRFGSIYNNVVNTRF